MHIGEMSNPYAGPWLRSCLCDQRAQEGACDNAPPSEILRHPRLPLLPISLLQPTEAVVNRRLSYFPIFRWRVGLKLSIELTGPIVDVLVPLKEGLR